MHGNPFGIVCGILSILVGFQDIQSSFIANEFGPLWYHLFNALAGYMFGVSVVTFFKNLEKVLQIAGVFAKWFAAAALSLIISAIYLVIQFNRVFS